MAAEGGVKITQTGGHDPHNDFNGDGRSDVLWRDTSGTITNWLGQAHGGFIGNNANLFTNVDPSWTLAGTGDFNGDGRADVLWRHTSGLVTDWIGQANGGFAPNNVNLFTNVDSSWKIIGTGDFNGDGRDDVLFRHTSGLLTDWLGQTNGGLVSNNANLFANVDSSWSVVATGDFNVDGRDDVLFRHSSGLLTNWLGEANGGLSPNNANLFTNVDPSWKVVGTGDFNGDGRDDILWRHSSGALTNWLGQANAGFAANNSNAFSQSEGSWHVVGIGDYNGDGRDDLAWRNDSGAFSEWLGQANGGFISNHGLAGYEVATTWKVQSPDIFVL